MEHIAVWGSDTNGIMDGPIVWIGTTTTTGGAWSVDYSGVGFTEVPVVMATLILAASNVYDRGFASLSATPTKTAASGYGVRGQNLLALGSTTRTVPDGTVVHVIAVGETFTA